MSLMQFEDLPSTNTPINAENLNNNFNHITQFLCVGLNGDYDITSTAQYQTLDIPLNTEYEREGNALKFVDGKIVIPAGVSKIIASANMVSQGSTANTGLYIRKNGTRIANTYSTPGNSSVHGDALSSRPIDVVEGDTIDLAIYFNSANVTKTIRGYDGTGTYLVVQVIK